MEEVRTNRIISIAGLSERRGNREEAERRAGQREGGCGFVCACACTFHLCLKLVPYLLRVLVA